MFLELGANQFYLRGQGRERSLFLAHNRVSCTIDCMTLTTRIYVCHSSHPCLPEDFPPKNQLVHFFSDDICSICPKRLSTDPKVKFYWCIMFQKIFATFALTDLMACTIVVLSYTMLTIFFGPPAV